MGDMTFKLNPGMLIGAASAATQVEGGELDHSWMDWYKKGHIKDDSSPARANDHYNLWREDAEIMRDLGLQVYRFGIEWARIEPEQGVFDEKAIKHYKDEIKLLLKYGIKPLVTLHHFTNPMWFEKMGGFEKIDNIEYFLNFVKVVVVEFGKNANEYITINEPNVFSTFGYFYGEWPPGKKSFSKAVKVMSVMAAAHIKAYELIHELRGEMGYSDTKVGFANHMRVFDPKNPKNISHRFFAKLTEHFFQGSISLAMYRGEFAWPLKNILSLERGKYSDFIGLNYYTRSTVKGLGDGVKDGAPINDLGWEIYADGIVECAKQLYELYPAPIYITENGTCDNDDSFRSLYIYEHIKALCDSELPVERYYHWCFTDNFEWIEGESARFGIVEVDYETQARTVKRSGEFLSAVIKAGGVDNKIYNKYIKGQKYNIADVDWRLQV